MATEQMVKVKVLSSNLRSKIRDHEVTEAQADALRPFKHHAEELFRLHNVLSKFRIADPDD